MGLFIKNININIKIQILHRNVFILYELYGPKYPSYSFIYFKSSKTVAMSV